MRTRLITTMIAVVLLAACQPSGQPTTPPPARPTLPIITPTPTPTPAPAPTPASEKDQILDLMQRFFDVEDKLQDPKTPFDIAYTVADGSALSDLNTEIVFILKRGWRFEGTVIRRDLQIGDVYERNGERESLVTYCVDNTPLKVFDKDGKPVAKEGPTLPYKTVVRKLPNNKWYVFSYENKLAPC